MDLEIKSPKSKSKQKDVSWTEIAIGAGVMVLNGALWGLSSTLAGRFVGGMTTASPQLDLVKSEGADVRRIGNA